MIKIPVPENLVVHQKSKALELTYADEKKYLLPFEFLRVHSPSAEVRGHGAGQEILQTGKRQVSILSLEPVGNYALKPTFTDGHDSGLFTWEYLHELCQNQDAMWQEYLARLEAAGVTRDTPMK
jgi:DUF971 family protein